MVTVCSGPRFESLKNPFTGLTMRTKMSVSSSGKVRYFAPDEYSPFTYFDTAKEAYRHYSRVNGVEGMRSGKLVCPVTGNVLRLEHDDRGYHYVGGFNPAMMYSYADWFYYASMRDGVTKFPKPKEDNRVSAVPKAPKVTKAARRHAEEEAVNLTEDAVKLAEKSLSDLKSRGFDIPGSSTVSMSRRSK